MNAAAKVLPLPGAPVTQLTPAERLWVANSAHSLVHGDDIKFKRRLQEPQGITFERFLIAVDEFAMEKLSASGASQSALGRLIYMAKFGSAACAREAADAVLNCPNPKNALFEIAEGLLRPLAADGVIAQRENEEL
ncbi:hypothetical protein [Pseudomonas syringae]|uniref:hypothetical protein n=1 Tax=Pseudomonas syringae TaxID=317 RepID=UPI001F10AA4C|nr:hypothetical protein [Pseudomonas syringae]MCH5508851.1 hypothetical protein [Pseudomonas syringae pv. syringae]MCH5637646.1 hypothetical protein [Pseudomonas syringae pv. syringae]MCH7426779.1 hypothetical protein [Pseudomonas syringae pv. syringae]